MSRAVVQVALIGSSTAKPRMRCWMPVGRNRRSVRQLPLHGGSALHLQPRERSDC